MQLWQAWKSCGVNHENLESTLRQNTSSNADRRSFILSFLKHQLSADRGDDFALNFKFAPASASQSLRISNFIYNSFSHSHLCVRVSQKIYTFLFAFRFYFYIRIRNAHDAIAKEFLEFHKKKNKTRNASFVVRRFLLEISFGRRLYTARQCAETCKGLEFFQAWSQNIASRQLPTAVHKNHSISSRAYASPHKQRKNSKIQTSNIHKSNSFPINLNNFPAHTAHSLLSVVQRRLAIFPFRKASDLDYFLQFRWRANLRLFTQRFSIIISAVSTYFLHSRNLWFSPCNFSCSFKNSFAAKIVCSAQKSFQVGKNANEY